LFVFLLFFFFLLLGQRHATGLRFVDSRDFV